MKEKSISLSLAIFALLASPSWAQTLPTSKEVAMIAGSYMGVMNLCRDEVDIHLTAEARSFAEKAQHNDPKTFDASYNAEGHGMTFYDADGCLSVWRDVLGPDGEKSRELGFTIMVRGQP
ncbi:hypothetical protein [uncultured Nitratireductor sp.]|uniref:hypothetical protein n=1 Tax=uncultured Nitratireductor sp. TaxID=520953 RepID=UPI0025F45DEE|nr:hypothetical protein [uncultured Nitratireductor sp.]